MLYQKLEIHEAAHAVIAVRLGMPFIRILMDYSLVGDKVMPPGITNLTGDPEQMRMVSIAGCVAGDYFDRVSPDQISTHGQLNRNLEGSVAERVLRCLESHSLDKKQYLKNSNPANSEQFVNDIETAERMIQENWTQIERVASHLYQLKTPKSMMRDEVVKFMNLEDC